MQLGIEGRVALVMGSSRGIGRGIAEALSREGATVAVCARSRGELEAVRDALPGPSGAFVADTADLERMAALPGEVERALGPVQILVTNTGGPPGGTALEHGREQWQRAYTSLVLAVRELVGACLPAMRRGGWGRIVNVASTSVSEPIPGLALSNVHRAAATAFLATLAREVAAEGITVNTVASGRFDTDRLAELAGSRERAVELARDQVPAGRLGTPAEYGDLAAFVCSEPAGYLTGACIPLDGGLTRGS